MDPSRPLVLAAARYASSSDAGRDYQIVWDARHGGAFDHVSVALLTSDTHGVPHVQRHGSTARDLALSGAVLSAALLVVAPAADVAVAAVAGGRPGARGIAAHLRHTIPDERLQEVSEVLGFGECRLLVVAIDRRGTEISPLLEQAEKAVVVETRTGDLDAAFYGILGGGNHHDGACDTKRHARATTGDYAGRSMMYRS